MTTKINFCGAIYDVSGYGEFGRYFIESLDRAGVDLGVEPIVISPQKLNYGKKIQTCEKLLNKGSKAEVNVINMIPPLFRRYKKKGAINVGFTMWEADRLPAIWTKLCNEMDAIMVPCEWNVRVFRKSGVTVPIYHCPAGIDLQEVPSYENPYDDDEFKFYSIFQWLERKAPTGLVKAFMSEFTPKDKVSLTLKTYVRDKGDNAQTLHKALDLIRDEMKIKEKDHAPIRLITELLSDEDMTKLHQESDCFVLPHRGEGWGMPHMDAMLHGNPVIATGYSGNMDFMNENNSWLVDYQLTPSCNVGNFAPFYHGRMWWAEPDLSHLAILMRAAYDDPSIAEFVGKKGREHVIENFNNETSAREFMKAIDQIVRK